MGCMLSAGTIIIVVHYYSKTNTGSSKNHDVENMFSMLVLGPLALAFGQCDYVFLGDCYECIYCACHLYVPCLR